MTQQAGKMEANSESGLHQPKYDKADFSNLM